MNCTAFCAGKPVKSRSHQPERLQPEEEGGARAGGEGPRHHARRMPHLRPRLRLFRLSNAAHMQESQARRCPARVDT